ncbi:methylase involved in ubiquinone/menaquinone biosynthesis, partial [Thaumarchaeota archaeon SCGC AB-539-E09]
MLSLKKGYDQIEGEYYTRSRLFRWWHTNRFRKSQEIVSDMEEGSIIIDLGCDGGNFTQRLLNYGEVVGLDISSNFIRSGKRRVKTAHFIISDVQKLPLRHASFDLVTCMEVLEHLPRPDLVVSESSRILRKSGRLLVSTPDDGKRLWRIIWFFWQNIG